MEGRASESCRSGASINGEISRPSKIYKVSGIINESPVVKIDATNLEGENARFYIDAGADVNVLKMTALLPDTHVDATEQASFHVVRHTFPISVEGILGRPYLRLERSNISFFDNTLTTQSRPVDTIPLIDPGSTKANFDFNPDFNNSCKNETIHNYSDCRVRNQGRLFVAHND